MRTQFVTDKQGKKVAVILPLKEYKKIIEELEDIQDVRLYDKAKARKQKFIAAEDVLKPLS